MALCGVLHVPADPGGPVAQVRNINMCEDFNNMINNIFISIFLIYTVHNAVQYRTRNSHF